MPAVKTKRSLKLACPACGQNTDLPNLSLDLNNLDEITCGECQETFSPAEAAQRFVRMAEAWQRVSAWIEAAPLPE